MSSNRRVTKAGVDALKGLLLLKARECLHMPEGLLEHPFVTPTYDIVAGEDDGASVSERSLVGFYVQMYDWDACLFAQSAHRAGIAGLPLSVVANFLSLQREDGFIPRTVSPNQVWDEGDLCKPFLAQTLLSEVERTEGAWEVKCMLDQIEKHLNFFRSHRQHESGLFSWRNVLESGVDNNFALLAPQEAHKDENQTNVNYPDGRLLAVDLNSYLVSEFRAFARLCDDHRTAEFNALADELSGKIEEMLWDESLGMYVNVDPLNGEKVQMRSWVGLAPVLFGISSPERTARVVSDNILNERHFLRKFGIASMANSELLSNQSPRGLYGRAIVCNWNGPVWVLPNVLVARKLVSLGMVAEARDIARRVVSALILDMNETGVLHENYNADTGQSLWAPKFMSFNIMALELIELLQSRNVPAHRG